MRSTLFWLSPADSFLSTAWQSIDRTIDAQNFSVLQVFCLNNRRCGRCFRCLFPSLWLSPCYLSYGYGMHQAGGYYSRTRWLECLYGPRKLPNKTEALREKSAAFKPPLRFWG